MPKDKYEYHIGIKITAEQKKKIDNSGLATSEFVRNAIDFFSETRLNATSNIKINVINECISELNNLKENVKFKEYAKFNNSLKNVKSLNKKEANVKQNEGLVYKENTPENANKKTLNVFNDDEFNSINENVKPVNFEDWLKKDITLVQTVCNLINLNGKVTKDNITFLASKHNISEGELKTFIDANWENLQNMNIQQVRK